MCIAARYCIISTNFSKGCVAAVFTEPVMRFEVAHTSTVMPAFLNLGPASGYDGRVSSNSWVPLWRSSKQDI